MKLPTALLAVLMSAGPLAHAGTDLTTPEKARAALEAAVLCRGPWPDGRDKAVAKALRHLGVKVRAARSPDEMPFFSELQFDPPWPIAGVPVTRIRNEGDSGGVYVAFAIGDAAIFARSLGGLKRWQRTGDETRDLMANGWGYGGLYFRHSVAPSDDNPYPDDFFIGAGRSRETFQFGCQQYDY